ncbi:MAG: stress response translation initiation inhibitor YciH [Pseudomonadales bacterium]|nr:stress response translation initiation inhibitor YciH [Pseudomonadales bacterium]
MARKNTVYSTDQGRHCSGCGLPMPACTCQTPEAVSGDGVVRLHRKVKGRNGKPVTLISGLPLAAVELKSLAKELKNKCGGGGSIVGKDILIQGDKRDRLKEVLESKGYQVKLSGG